MREDADFFQHAFVHADIGMAQIGLEGRYLRTNQKLSSITGYSESELSAYTLQDLLHPEDVCATVAGFDDLLNQRIASFTTEQRLCCNGGRHVWVQVHISFAADASGEPLYGVAIYQDTGARKLAEQQTAITHQRYTALFEQLPDGLLLVDDDLRVVDHNQEALTLLGYTHRELLSLRIGDIDTRATMATIESRKLKIQNLGRDDFETNYKRKDGSRLFVDVSGKYVVLLDGTRMFQVLFRDISQKKQAAALIEKIAYSDQLTGLANRTLLADRLHQAMAQSSRRGERLAVVFLDLDGFKAVNDRYGHATGDDLLKVISERMRDGLREGDTLARLGGDEFVAVLLDLESTDASFPLLERLLEASSREVRIGDLHLQVSASMGVTYYPQGDEVDADQLLRQADQAMYQAKLAGKNRYCLFDAERDRNLRGHNEVLQKIRDALTMQQFVLHYQPKVNLRTREFIGVEALIRWQHPEKGLLAPGTFLPLIENHSLSIEVGEWVICQALDQLAQWRAQGLHTSVSVNISALQLQQKNFFERLHSLLQAHSELPPNCLELEILETSALEEIDQVARFIARCADLNVRFALDDFGTGYSSLTYLTRLPVSTVKIDQSFVRDMIAHKDNMSILDGILWIMRQLERSVIAEGVETLEHGRVLMDLGCEMAQGYGIARPMPAEHLLPWIARWNDDAEWKAVSLVPRTAV